MLLLAIMAPAHAADIVINNGLDCSNPGNVIDDDTYEYDTVYVRNAGCPPFGAMNPDDPCPSPGAPTDVCLVTGGSVTYLTVMDSSTVTMSGGRVNADLAAYGFSNFTISGGSWSYAYLHAYDSSTVTMSGGSYEPVVMVAYDSSSMTIEGGSGYELRAYDSSSITMNDGGAYGLGAHGSSTVTVNGGGMETGLGTYDSSTATVNGGSMAQGLAASGFSIVTVNGGRVDFSLRASDSSTVTINGGQLDWWSPDGLGTYDSSTVTVVGTGFAVDGSPVPHGDLTTQTGTLTGRLVSGGIINQVFHQGGGDYTGTITLALPGYLVVPALSRLSYLALVSCLIGFGVAVGRRRRT